MNANEEHEAEKSTENGNIKQQNDTHILSNIARKLVEELKAMELDTNSSEFRNSATPTTNTDIGNHLHKIRCDDPRNVAKVTPDRIYSVTAHPSSSTLLSCAGDKSGHVGLWRVDSVEDENDGVYLFRPHKSPVNALEWDAQGHHLYSFSYDGTVRCMDPVKEVFTEVFDLLARHPLHEWLFTSKGNCVPL